MNRPITNVVFKGADFMESANSVEIHEDIDVIKVYVELLLSMDSEIDDELHCFENLLINTTEIGFSNGIKGSYIPYFKNINHIYTDNLGFRITPNRSLTYKVMAVFRNKE